jgi:hypothetical protein
MRGAGIEGGKRHFLFFFLLRTHDTCPCMGRDRIIPDRIITGAIDHNVYRPETCMRTVWSLFFFCFFLFRAPPVLPV